MSRPVLEIIHGAAQKPLSLEDLAVLAAVTYALIDAVGEAPCGCIPGDAKYADYTCRRCRAVALAEGGA